MGLQMGSKRLDIVRQLVPTATKVTMLVNPKFPTVPGEVRDMQDAARSLGVQIDVLNASTQAEIDAAFRVMAQGRTDALVVATDPFLLAQRDQLVRLAAQHKIPTIYFLREFADAGGLPALDDDPWCRPRGVADLSRHRRCPRSVPQVQVRRGGVWADMRQVSIGRSGLERQNIALWSWLKAWAMQIAKRRGMKKAIVGWNADWP